MILLPPRFRRRGPQGIFLRPAHIGSIAASGGGGAGGGGGGPPTDPDFASVVALLHMDGADASTTFTDVKGHTFTAAGNAQLDTAAFKFGTASGLFDGVDDRVSSGVSVDWNLTADFTVEAWIKLSASSAYGAVCAQWGAGATTNKCWFCGEQDNKLTFAWYGTGGTPFNQIQTTAQTLNDAFHHIAWCRASGTLRIFLDGTELTSGAVGTLQTGAGLWLGTDGDLANDYAGWIDDLRITKGVARYTANFTPPSAAFPDA